MIDKEQENQETENVSAPKKISLKRKSVSTIKVKRASGKAATVNVVRKKRKVYVNKSPEEAKKLLMEEDSIPEKTEETPSDEVQVEETKVEETKVEEKPEAETVEEPVSKVGMKVEPVELTKKPIEEKKKPSTKDSSSDSKSADTKPKPKPAVAKKESEFDNDKKKKKGKSSREDKSSKGWKNTKINSLDDAEAMYYQSKGPRKSRRSHIEDENKHAFSMPVEPKIHEVLIPETITVAELSKRMSIKASEVIKALMKMGMMTTINQAIDQDTATLVVEELGHKPVAQAATTVEDDIEISYSDESSPRDPVITVMGHVDHGKTTLLDHIRKANVAAGESGGITQHMAAYRAKTSRGTMTFLDTPGHSAFTAMRARGASCTDIVILVVAADDGVMPQTKEAIQHAQAANVPIVVAINKIDKAEADPDRVTNELAQFGLMPESWGGDAIFCPISAKQGTGVEELLENVYLQSELLELNAHAKGSAQGVVLESRLDKGRGPVSTVLIQSGELRKGDMALAGTVFGRVRMMLDENGKEIKVAGPSIPVQIMGLSGPSVAGDKFQSVDDERKAREVAEHRAAREKEAKLVRQRATQLDGAMNRMAQSGEMKELNLIVKADVQGSVEVLIETLQKLSNTEINVKVVSSGVGGFNESDVNLAMASNAVLIGFNVRADASARKLAQEESVSFHYYSVIYDIIDGIKSVISGKIGPKYEDRIVGLAQVKDVFRSSKIGAIAGCMVIEGSVKRGNPIRVLRDNVVIYEGELESLRRFKDDVNDVKSGTECGIGVKQYNDIKPGDQIEVFEKVKVEYKFED